MPSRIALVQRATERFVSELLLPQKRGRAVWRQQGVSQRSNRSSSFLRRGASCSSRSFASSSSFSSADLTALASKKTSNKQVTASRELSTTPSVEKWSASSHSSSGDNSKGASASDTSSIPVTVVADHEERYHEVLRAVALEAEQILTNCQLLRSTTIASPQNDVPTPLSTLDEVMSTLLEVSRRPQLLESLESLSTLPSGQSSRLLLHRAFITVLSAAVDAAAQAIEIRNDDTAVRWQRILQLTRQAQRLHLPLHVPYLRKLAMTVATHTSHRRRTSSPSSIDKSLVAALLEIADWSARIQNHLGDSGPAKADRLQATKLRFLVPSLKLLLERRQYEIVLDVVHALVDGNTDLNADRVVDLDFDVVIDLLTALRRNFQDHPSDASEIRLIVMLLEPSALKFVRTNEEWLDEHPQVRAFLDRFFLGSEGDEEDQDIVWDPFVVDLILNDKTTASAEDRLISMSNFYSQISMVMGAKLIQVTRLPAMQPRDGKTDEDESDWSSDGEDSAASSAEEEDDSESDALALRRHHMYLRGRGRPLDANHFPDVTAQAIKLNGGLNLRFTDEYEDLIWKRDYQDEEEDMLSMMTLDDSGGSDSYSDDSDDDNDMY